MKSRLVGYAITGILALGLALPVTALADDDDVRRCKMQGTWFGVWTPELLFPTGWMVTVAGKSNNHGTNILEFPTYNPTLNGRYEDAVRLSTLRGAWRRTGRNTFEYKMMGIAVAANGAPAWYGRVSGTTTLSSDCQTELITARLEAWDPDHIPFYDPPDYEEELDPHYGYRIDF